MSIRADPADGRAKIVAISAAGRAMRQASMAALAPLLAELDGLLPHDDLVALLPRLRTLGQLLDKERDQPK